MTSVTRIGTDRSMMLDVLEKLTERVRNGELTSFVGVGMVSNGDVLRFRSGTWRKDVFTTVGALEAHKNYIGSLIEED